MKIAHEAPNVIFKEVEKLTDYTYALVHLFEEDEQYRNNIFEAKKNGREIILDNSIFELGEAFDAERFAYWVGELKPDWYIVPDSLENSSQTILNYVDFIRKYPNLPGKKIGVLQGKTYLELINCYKVLTGLGVDMIGISFDYSLYHILSQQSQWEPLATKFHEWSKGRQLFVEKLFRESFFRKDIPIHLLGCSLPQEFKYYKDRQDTFGNIYSLDTSNPVVHGLKDVKYEGYGLDNKESQKLFTLINAEVSEEQLELVKHNIEIFKSFAK